MKSEWITQPLSSLCEVAYGTRVVRKKDGGSIYPVYGGGGATFHMDAFNREDCFIVSRFGMSADCVRKVEGRFFLNDSGLSVSSREPDRLLQAFLDRQLLARQAEIYRLGKGTAQKNLDVPQFRELLISYPEDLAEQQRIVAVLDDAFAVVATAIANAEKSRAHARGILLSAIDAAFSNCDGDTATSELRALIDITHGFAFDGSQFETSDDPSKPIVLTPGNYTEDAELSFTPKNTKRLVAGVERTGFRFEVGDLTIVMTDLSSKMKILGRPAFVEADNILHNQRIGRISLKDDKVSLRLIYYFMQSSAALGNIRDTATGTMVRHTAPKRILSNIITYPRSPEAQLALVKRLDTMRLETRALERVQIAKVAMLKGLKQSLLLSAFAGTLVSKKSGSPVSATVTNFTSSQFAAQVIAFAHQRHERQQKQKTFGHVKAQKALHLVESIGGIDLGRHPIKDAAGPNDFQHMLRATDWAARQGFFEFAPRSTGNGYDFRKLANYDSLFAKALAATRSVSAALDRAIEPIVPMVSQDAEVFATVHAAWNNLLHEGVAVSDDAIVKEARDHWHSAKLKIPEEKFRSVINCIRAMGLVPDGTAKYVGGQGGLF